MEQKTRVFGQNDVPEFQVVTRTAQKRKKPENKKKENLVELPGSGS
jgi:hypothetical protein